MRTGKHQHGVKRWRLTKRKLALIFASVTIAAASSWWVSQRPSQYGFEEQYALNHSEIFWFEFRGRGGDCEAARRLTSHYLNVALDFNLGLRWARVAARCPDVEAKKQLLILLSQLEPNPTIEAEIDDSIAQIVELDPREGEHIRSALNEVRNRKH
jgi:hypothetical protein